MATSAFKSTTKRTSIGGKSTADDSGSSSRSHRRSRSLSRFSRTVPENIGETPRRSGKFVNTVRGSGFPEISLDDLAVEFFSPKESSDERESGRGRLTHRISEANPAYLSSQRRGRSGSRQKARVSDGKSNITVAPGVGRAVPEAKSRRRRSVSVVRCQISDSESDRDHYQNSSNLAKVKSFSGGDRRLAGTTVSNHRRLERSLSQKDLPSMRDGYSSHSSALTDDEARDGHSSKNMIEKTIRTVYAQKKLDHPTGDDVNGGLYEAMKKELRHAVDEIKTAVRVTSASESPKCLLSSRTNVVQPASARRQNHPTKLGKLDKQKDDLLAEFLHEEKLRRDPSYIVFDPESKVTAGKPSRTRKKSKDRSRMSNRLIEEAEKYFEDFFSNFEDTDISSFDGDRSDASSTFGPTRSRGALFHSGETETFQSPAISDSPSVETEGVILPWLQWETSNDGSSHPLKNKEDLHLTPKRILCDAAEEMVSATDPSSCSPISSGKWRHEIFSNISKGGGSCVNFDMDRYLRLQTEEELLFDTWGERLRIDSGGLLLCTSSLL